MKARGQASGTTLGPTVAGTWYPADPVGLASRVNALVESASEQSTVDGGGRRIAALIVPHAGYDYSGTVAAQAFFTVLGADFSRVIVIGPSHYHAFEGLRFPRANTYRTPLGEILLDIDSMNDLADDVLLRLDDGPFRKEHCIDAALPFLQRCLQPGWTLIPALVGTRHPATLDEIGRALSRMRTPRTLVVISSDFTHYGRRFGFTPFDADVPRQIERLDLDAVRLILGRDVAGFESLVRATGATICGASAIGLLLRMLPEGAGGRLLAYDSSGRMTGDWEHAVAYASIVFECVT